MIVACLGDSITAGSPFWDPDPVVRERIGAAADERSQWEWWAQRAESRLELRNCGRYGERTDEIARRLDACAEGAAVLVVQGGINDVAQRRPVEGAAENLAAMLRRGRALGLAVLVAEVLPWNGGWPWAEEPIRRLNQLVARLAAAQDVPLLCFHAALEDVERPGRMREEWHADGDHPSVEGYRLLGRLVAGRLTDLLGRAVS